MSGKPEGEGERQKAVPLDDVRSEFANQNELVYLPNMLSSAHVETLLAEVRSLRRQVHRSYVPGYKKSGSLSYYQLQRCAPAAIELYRSPEMRALVDGLSGRRLHLSPDNDAQTCSVFVYDRDGDGMGPHIDSCYYCEPVYVVLIGLVNQSSSVLRCDTRPDQPDNRRRDIATEPGSITVFNGHTIRHSVTPVRSGEERIVLAMQYLVKPEMTRLTRLRCNLAYAWEYFGPSVLVPRPADRFARRLAARWSGRRAGRAR